MLKIRIIKEVYTNKQRKYMCAMKEPGADRPEGLSKTKAEEMCTGPMKDEEQLQEISAVAAGAVEGGSGFFDDNGDIEKFNEKEKKNSKLKGNSLEEDYSTAALTPGDGRIYMDDKTNNGRIERSRHQGLKNVPECKKRTRIKVRLKKKLSLNENSSVATNLIKFANIGHIKRKRETLWFEFLDKYGLETLGNAILEDETSDSRIDFISNQLGASQDLIVGVKNLENDSIRDYYDFLINEYLFWSYYNPHASPVRLATRKIKIGTEAKNLIRAHIARYIKDPSRNNPKSLSLRSIGKHSSSQQTYGDEPTLDPSLYDLPE